MPAVSTLSPPILGWSFANILMNLISPKTGHIVLPICEDGIILSSHDWQKTGNFCRVELSLVGRCDHGLTQHKSSRHLCGDHTHRRVIAPVSQMHISATVALSAYRLYSRMHACRSILSVNETTRLLQPINSKFHALCCRESLLLIIYVIFIATHTHTQKTLQCCFFQSCLLRFLPCDCM